MARLLLERSSGDRSHVRARARTARVMGRWVEVPGAVCSRLWVVLGRAVAQGSEGLFYPRSSDFQLWTVNNVFIAVYR